jgi:plastocyanin
MNIYSPRVKYIVSIFLMNSMISAAALISVFPSFLGVQHQTDFAAAAAQVQPQSQSELKEQNTTANNSDPGSALRLFEANIAIDLPLSKGYIDGNVAYFIATDASDIQAAESITNNIGFKINYAPLLAETPQDARGQGYLFLNGVKGDGPDSYQLPVANAVPGDSDYSPLWQTNFVKWNDNATARELKSVDAVLAAEKNGELVITPTNIIVNSPAIKWQNGSLQIRNNQNITEDNTPYGGGQALAINPENMTVTMVAHRGWGPDGRSVYYIATDAAPQMAADVIGVPYVSSDEGLVGTPSTIDLFQFTNGINGSGALGFQAGIGSANPNDSNYSPMWRISFIEWNNEKQANVLQTINDVVSAQREGLITISQPFEGKHVVNCAFFDASTIQEYRNKTSGGTSMVSVEGNMTSISNNKVDVSIQPGAAALTDTAFQHNPVNVKLGDTVRWTNNDNTLHTVIEGDSDTGQITGGFASDIVAPGGTFEYKFEKVGTFDYYCKLHPNMVGKVVVAS